MSDVKVRRKSKVFPATVATNVDNASTVRLDDMAGALVLFPSPPPSAATAVVVWVAASVDGPFVPLAGATLTLARVTDGTSFTGVSAAYALPLGVHRSARLSSTPAAFVRLVSNVDLGSASSVSVLAKG